MVFFNYSTMQMAAKIVYYGPGLCGKTTNLQWIYNRTAEASRGEMVSLETETDRTLFFDLLPIDVGQVGGFNTRIQLYTVPGQVFYNTTRKLVLKGVDGVVFVADSQRAMLEANVESFKNLEENLAELGIAVDSIPLVLQFNKRDLSDLCSPEELDGALNRNGWPTYEAVAIQGKGVFETLKGISRATLLSLKQRLGRGDAAPLRPAQRDRPPAAAVPRAAAAQRPPTAAAPAPPRAPAATAAPPARGPRRRVDVEGELARLREHTLAGVTPPRRTPAAPAAANGHRELSRDIKLTLSAPDFRRARRFTLSFQVEDDERRVVDGVEGLEVDLGDPEALTRLLLRLNIALQAKE